jgi:hypothetical protein
MAKIEDIDIVVRIKDGKYIAGIMQLGLLGTGDTAQAAIDQFELKRKKFIADMTEIGMILDIDVALGPSALGQLPATALEIRRPTLMREITGFGLKTLIFITILTVGFSFGANSVIDNARVSLKGTADQFSRMGGSKFWTKVLEDIDKLADDDMPAEKKQHILAQIKKIVQKWRPFADEASQLFTPNRPAEEKAK